MPAKRILLLYISAVSGHRSAAVAIEKALRLLSPQTQILNINAFRYTNPTSEKIINHLYMGVIQKMPKIWDYLYDNPSIVKKTQKIKEAIHKFNSPKLKSLFDEFKPDAVVCTQAFPCGMVADFKKTCDSGIPLIAVLTDYVPHSYWLYDSVDYYITPSDEVSERLIKKGVPSQKIRPLGIPFDTKFNEPLNKEGLLQKFKLAQDAPAILIMGGGQGLGPIKTIVRSLEKVKKEIQEIVVTGTNIKLYNSLTKEARKYKKRILVFNYIEDINELMSVADILITKPGGITTAEALAKKMPMIIVKPIPGQEANNTAYLIEKGAAVKVDNPHTISLIIEDLLANPDKLKMLRESAADISKPNASLDIAKLLLSL